MDSKFKFAYLFDLIAMHLQLNFASLVLRLFTEKQIILT